jgi:predicted dehydrogenase
MSKGRNIGVALVGIGGWGKNLARNYATLPDADLLYVCDLEQKRLDESTRHYPSTRMTRDYASVLADPAVDGVVIATSAPTHFSLAKSALEAGKDVYVEKPMVLDIAHGEELVRLAESRSKILMVGHLLEYHPVVLRLRDMIRSGELGRVHYIYTQRLNLGTIRGDENALWNFAPHDISSILFMLGQEPTDVSARGQCYLNKNVEDVVFMSMNFADKSMAHVHVSWLDPHKTRKMTIVGSRKMAVFDDLEGNEKLRIYDKGADINTNYETFAEYVGLRFGDILVPHIKVTEPLQLECKHFVDCIRSRRTPVSYGYDGLRVLRVLEAADRSLRGNGQPVALRPALAAAASAA